jgi:hypothetical protein
MNDKVNHSLLKASGIAAIVLAASLLVCGIFELCVLGLKNRLDYLDAGKRWSADGSRYAVIGLYAEESAGISADSAEGWTHSVDGKLSEASVTPAEGARAWAYCYGTDAVLQVVGPKGNANAETIAANGDFFVFHQLKFRYGSGFLNDPVNPMGVVLDRDLAWRVFGAENVVGMTVTVSGEEFTVVGIAEKESSAGPYTRAYGTTPRMYMSYAGFSKIGEGNITFFEAALPNAVKGFAYNIFTESVPRNEDSTAVAEATDRFSIKNRFENMKELTYAWVSINKIEFPYWVNEARVYDYRAAVMMLFEVAAAAVGGLSLVLSFIFLRISGWSLISVIKGLFSKIAEARGRKKKERPEKTEPREKKKTRPERTGSSGQKKGKSGKFKRIRRRKID